MATDLTYLTEAIMRIRVASFSSVSSADISLLHEVISDIKDAFPLVASLV